MSFLMRNFFFVVISVLLSFYIIKIKPDLLYSYGKDDLRLISSSLGTATAFLSTMLG